jgi:hypothetical protein
MRCADGYAVICQHCRKVAAAVDATCFLPSIEAMVKAAAMALAARNKGVKVWVEPKSHAPEDNWQLWETDARDALTAALALPREDGETKP